MARIRIEFLEPTLFTHEIPVRITDLNYGDHLGHDALVSLLHEARARFFRSLGKEESDVDGAGILLVELVVTYLAQVHYGQTLTVEIAAGEIGRSGCALVYRVRDRDRGTDVALARTGIVFFDYDRHKVVPMPESFRDALEAD
jgi:acyl-CoA thioesterase FadM